MRGALLVTIVGLAIFLLAARPPVVEHDLYEMVLLDFDPGDYYPYYVYNNTLFNAPVVLPMVPRDVLIAELALSTTTRIPAGVYVAVPRRAFARSPPPVPPNVRGRVVDLEVPGLGVARLVLAKGPEDLPAAGLATVFTFVEAEERNGRLFVGGRPLDVRRPIIRGEPPRRQEKSNSAEVGVTAVTETATGTAVASWADYIFAPASPAKIAVDGYDTGFKAIRYFNLTIGPSGEFTEAPARGQRYTGNKTVWAYLGYGVREVWAFFSGSSSSTLWYKVCAYSAPGPPPRSVYDSACTSWMSASGTSMGRAYVARINLTQWSSRYVWFYADVYSTGPINGSIAVIYSRPAPSAGNVYSLMHGVWWSSAVQPGVDFTAYYFIDVNRLMFTFRIPPGARADPSFTISGLRVTTCGGYTSLTVSVYVPTRPDLRTTVTSTSRRWTGFSDCYTYTFPTIGGSLRREAIAPILAGNATAVPVMLEFSPTLKPKDTITFSQPVEVRFTVFSLWGQRWPEIWRHDASNWFSDVRYPTINLPVRYVLRDILTYVAWNLPYPVNESVYPPAGYPAMAYVTYTHMASISSSSEGAFSRSALEYAYNSRYNVQLKRVCNALERYSDGGVRVVGIFVDNPGYNPDFEFYISVASSIVNTVGHAVTMWSLLAALNIVPGGQVASVLGYAVWGISLALRVFQPTSLETCNPSAQYVSAGYRASTGYVKSATWEIATNYPIPFAGAKRVSVNGMVITEFSSSTQRFGTGQRIYAPLITYYYSNRTYFTAPFEPYVYGWSRYYIKIG
ncbi:MAG: hypothetical protein QXT13_05825 [Pyrobaculum sp.]